jgi:hypothetical protein
MNRIKKVNVIVLCIWVVLISLVVYKDYRGYSLDRHQRLEEAFEKKTYWHDIYRGKKKAGFTQTTFQKAGDEILTEHSSEIRGGGKGEGQTFVERISSLSDMSYHVSSFEYAFGLKGEEEFRAFGEFDEEEMVIFLESSSKRKTHKTSVKNRNFFLPVTFVRALNLRDLSPDTAFTLPVLNLASLSIDNVRVVLEEIRPLKIGVLVYSLYKFRVGDMIVWINENGIIVKKEDPRGITFYSQHETFAGEERDRVLFDYTSLPYIQSNRLIGDTRELTRLRLRIKGFRPDPAIFRNRDIMLESDIMTISKVSVEELRKKMYTLPYEKKDMMKYIHPDKWVLSDDASLRETARIYARSYDGDPLRFAKYLTGYMDGLINVWPMFSLADSKGILESRSGDYIERTVMFATYARAGGLPTRLVGGLIYVKGYFYYHTWPEIWLGRWVPVDPVFVQFPADVTHIPLSYGTLEDIISITDDLKDLRIEILEAL